MSLKLPIPQGLSFLRSVGWFEERKADAAAARQRHSPRLKLQTDREVYRPGDSVTATIEICTPAGLKDDAASAETGEDAPSLLVDGLSFEIKGIEKLDSQWFSVSKPLPGSKQRRGTLLQSTSNMIVTIFDFSATVPVLLRFIYHMYFTSVDFISICHFAFAVSLINLQICCS